MTLRQNIAKINFVPFSGWVIALSLVVYVPSRCICAMQSIRLKSKCYCQIKREMKKRKRKNGTFTHTQNACWSFKMELSMAEKKVDDRRQGAHSSCSNIKRFDHYDNCIRLTPWLYSLEHFAVDHLCVCHAMSWPRPIQCFSHSNYIKMCSFRLKPSPFIHTWKYLTIRGHNVFGYLKPIANEVRKGMREK